MLRIQSRVQVHKHMACLKMYNIKHAHLATESTTSMNPTPLQQMGKSTDGSWDPQSLIQLCLKSLHGQDNSRQSSSASLPSTVPLLQHFILCSQVSLPLIGMKTVLLVSFCYEKQRQERSRFWLRYQRTPAAPGRDQHLQELTQHPPEKQASN